MSERVEFEVFLRDHTTPLLRTAFLLTGNKPEAEDLLQETLLRLYAHWDKVEQADSVAAYARRSLVNRFLTERAKRARQLVVQSVDSAAAADPAQTVVETQTMITHLAVLPARQRAAVVLRFYCDWSEQQIAGALGARPSTVRSLVARGLASLRLALNGDHMTRTTDERRRRV